MKRRKTGRFLLLTMLWLWIFAGTLYAEVTAVDAVFVEEDENKGFHMVCGGIGGFSSNVKPGDTASVAVISLDEGLEADLYLDGEKQNFSSGEVLYTNGSYELRIYKGSERENVPYGRYQFKIKNTFDEELSGQDAFELVTNPEIEISQDEVSGHYRYVLPNKSSFTLSIPSGGVSTGAVWMTLSDNISILKAEHDGQTVYQVNSMIFEEEGSYHLTLFSTGSSSDSAGYTSGGYGNFQVDVFFVITPRVTNRLEFVNAPVGFRFEKVSWNDKEIAGKGTTRYLEQDGSYRILFSGESDSSITYEISFQLDRRPPSLTFSRDISKKLVSSPLRVTASEPGSTIEVAHNGNISELTDSELVDGGHYLLIVKDQAGNTRSYSVNLKYASRIPVGEGFLLAVILVIGAGLWVRYQRDHMQIR